MTKDVIMQLFHSRSYHRFFEDYSEIEEADLNGHIRINRTYIGNYYTLNGDYRFILLKKIKIAILYLCAVFLYTAGGLQKTCANVTWYVSLFQALSLITLLGLIYPLFYYITANNRITIRIYRDSHLVFKKISCAASLCLFAAAGTVFAATVRCVLSGTDFKLKEELFVFTGLFISGILTLLIFLTKRKETFMVTSGDKKTDEKSVVIHY
jgi:hypothetical protein